jgi:hypothetical protein
LLAVSWDAMTDEMDERMVDDGWDAIEITASEDEDVVIYRKAIY